MDPTDALRALDQISEAKQVTARSSSAPRGYYALNGLAMGVLVVSESAPLPWQIACVITGGVLIALAWGWYRQRVDTWPRGSWRGKGSWSIWVIALVTFGCLITSILIRSVPLSIVLGILVLCVWVILGQIWDRTVADQVREQK